ncbi:MAG TPA: EAL domain-containing protein [Thermoanaerobaculia bacterium]|jgi:diguanylate cyclase (GGDEF)-like protein|nr:EAL domain-containing protein [Thermoanaerobaculia bacterium]
MLDTSLVIFTSNVAQALGALVLALVLVGFHRLYQRRFLLIWAWSWSAFCASLIAGTIALFLTPHMTADAPLRFSASVISMTAGYWQAAWLIFGTYEVVTDRLLSRRILSATPAALFVLAFVMTLGSLPIEPRYRVVMRVGTKCLVLGIAFVVAAWGVWRSRSRAHGLGRRMVSGAFLLYGLHQFHYLVILTSQVIGVGSMSYAAYLAPFDFLFQTVIGVGMVIWLLEDERQRVLAASARIEHLAYHDSLTDLPNRNLLVQQLQTAIDRAAARRERLAVLFLDLDRFKVVNESLGNRHGDELLKSFSERLRHGLRGTDLIARVAADEFAVFLPAIEAESVPIRVAEKLLGITRLPFALQGREVYLTASIGISRCPEDGIDAESLLKHAEIAMYRAKETSGDAYQVYATGMGSNSLEQISLEADLRRALTQERGELELFYQPVLDSVQGRVQGVEALLRWRHPSRGLMTPGEFLWLAEVSGLASVLDLWVLRTACREVQTWRGEGGLDLQLAVNLSPRTFQQADLLSRVQRVLAETGFPPCSLVLEITETLAMQNAEATLAVLRGLKDLGVQIAIDDFGTGYSSLSYLTTFPIDTLKVDRSFVHTLGRGRGGEEVAAAVIALAVSLGISVIAEGVEDEEQLRWLEGLGCERFQGYLFSPPLPAAECRDLMVQGTLDARLTQAGRLLGAAPRTGT